MAGVGRGWLVGGWVGKRLLHGAMRALQCCAAGRGGYSGWVAGGGGSLRTCVVGFLTLFVWPWSCAARVLLVRVCTVRVCVCRVSCVLFVHACREPPRERMHSSKAVLVLPCTRDVAHPLDRLVLQLGLNHLQKAHVEPRRGEHRHREVHGYWGARPRLLLRDGCDELHLGAEGLLGLPGEFSDSPHNGVLCGRVLRLAIRCVDFARGCVARRGDLHHHALPNHLAAEVGFDGDLHLHARAPNLAHHGKDAEGDVDVLCDAILHELKLAVGWHKRDGAVCVELVEFDALVECAVVHLDALAPPACARAPPHHSLLLLHHQLVVHAKLALGHAGEVALHQHLPRNVGPQQLPLGRHKDVDRLHCVDEDLVLAVLDALAAPRDGARHLHRHLCQLLCVLHAALAELLARLHDVQLECIQHGGLGVPEIHDFIQNLVHKHEVAVDRVFIEVAQVGLENVHQLVHDFKYRGRVGILCGDGHHPHVPRTDVAVRCVGKGFDGAADVFGADHLDSERFRNTPTHVISEDAIYEHLPLLIYEKQASQHSRLCCARACVRVCARMIQQAMEALVCSRGGAQSDDLRTHRQARRNRHTQRDGGSTLCNYRDVRRWR
mmetsp:Transcript_27336/g.68629  ORF Transcript_27336/g.68629 Transcript_27336/m.68629 type:complete len:607 (-) Transcript_27336:60-1880(-)